MNLSEEQKQNVTHWIRQGLKLSEIQTRLANDLGLKLTYMETRFLVDDLQLVPKDPERPRDSVLLADKPTGGQQKAGTARPPEPGGSTQSGNVSVEVDTVARAGAIVSGRVTFSDGNKAEWYLDQLGRLGLSPDRPGYQPPAADLDAFQMKLQSELQRMGF